MQLKPVRRLTSGLVQEIEKPYARHGHETVEWGGYGIMVRDGVLHYRCGAAALAGS